MSTRRHFDEAEDRYILDHFSSSRCGDIARHLGRSTDGVRKRARALGIPARKCMRWTAKEDSVLLSARGRSLADVAQELGRGAPECGNRAHILGITSWRWVRNGGRFRSKRGYVVIGFRRPGGGLPTVRIFEHIAVMEQSLGRPIAPPESVHHINGVKDDNRVENLFLCRDPSHHRTIHSTFESLLPRLIEAGVVHFNRDTESYEVR